MDERKTTNKSDVGTGEILEEKARWCIREALVGVSEMSMLFASTPAAMVPGDDTEHMRDQRGKKKAEVKCPPTYLSRASFPGIPVTQVKGEQVAQR